MNTENSVPIIKPSTPVDDATKAKVLAESRARSKRGEFDENFDDCEGVVPTERTPENQEKLRQSFAACGFK